MGVETATCPAGICQKKAAMFDHDRMFGHLLVDHSWTFETAQSWVVDNMASEEESRQMEAQFASNSDGD